MLPVTTDLRPIFTRFNLPNRRQGPRGTCSVFTVVGGLEYAMAVKDGHGTRLSIEFLNWASHKAANRTADGGFFSELWNGYESSGICKESDLPYLTEYDVKLQPSEPILQKASQFASDELTLAWIKEWDPNTGLTGDQINAIKSILDIRWPVLGGFCWPKKVQWNESVLAMCAPEDVFDGHSVLLVGYKDDPAQLGGGVFLIRNSGGDGSDGFLPYVYVSKYMNDAAWIGCKGKSPPPVGA